MVSKYQVMPNLQSDEYKELKEDIAARGVMIAIEYDEDGNVLDGHHRLKICEELGITDFPTITRSGMSEDEKRTHARKLNMARRHLTQEQKRSMIREQLSETPEMSDRQIAKALGVSDKTVGVQRKDLESRAEIPRVEEVIDTMGRKQPRPTTPKPATVPNAALREKTAPKNPTMQNEEKPMLLADRIKELPESPIILDGAIMEYIEKYRERSYHFRERNSLSEIVNVAVYSYLWDEGIMQGITGDKEGYIWRQFYLASRQLSHVLDKGTQFLNKQEKQRVRILMDEFNSLWGNFNKKRERE